MQAHRAEQERAAQEFRDRAIEPFMTALAKIGVDVAGSSPELLPQIGQQHNVRLRLDGVIFQFNPSYGCVSVEVPPREGPQARTIRVRTLADLGAAIEAVQAAPCTGKAGA